MVAFMNKVKRTNAHTKAITKFLFSCDMASFSKKASANASDTAPRRPPHHITVLKPRLTGGQIPVALRTGRIPCVSNARAPNPTISMVPRVIHISGPKTARIVGTAMPTRTNMSEFAQNPKVSQVS